MNSHLLSSFLLAIIIVIVAILGIFLCIDRTNKEHHKVIDISQ